MTEIQNKKRILVAPLNWGLGHATRCIPIIKALEAHYFEPIIASDGIALDLLRKEFPELETYELPSYNISYPKNGKHFKLKLLHGSTKLIKAIKAERKAIASIVETQNIDGIISDNRLGAHHKQVPCVFMTHQLKVLSGNTTWLSTKLHQKIIKRFNECWVPDIPGDNNLSGSLGHQEISELPVHYIGPLSRFSKATHPIKYDLMVLLSGPEPQRSILESKLLTEVKDYNGQVIMIKGLIEAEQKVTETNDVTIYNYMTSSELEQAINTSKLVLARSGYTTIMDLAKLNKKAFFIPTPGQFEQEYLANRLQDLGYVPSCKQKDFSMDKLAMIANYKGLTTMDYAVNWKELFGLFKGK